MSEIDNVLQNSIEYLPNKIYYVALKSTVPPRPIPGVHFFSIDKELMYWNFYLDFGPLHLGHTIRFCNILNEKLKDPNISKKKIILFSLPGSNFRTNAACLLCCWGLLYNHMTPQESFLPFKNLTFPYFHDATPGLCTYKLTILDVLQGVNKAIQKKYLTLDTFNLNEYYYYEKVENGDLTWISKKFIAFAGPQDRTCGNDPLNSNSYAHTPEEYIPYFKQHDVTLVVRLNKKQYDERKFINAGIDHLDLIYNDGGNPTEYILKRFIDACDATPGVVAVHCKAGLGRTGTCIGCYIMSNDQFTSKEVIGWLRICRPGSVIGPQQQFMDEMESRLWKLGESKARSGNKKIEESMEKLQLNSTEPGSPKKVEIIADDLSQGDFLNTKKRDVQLQGAANIVQSLVK